MTEVVDPTKADGGRKPRPLFGILCAIASAILFGFSTPLAKALTPGFQPQLMAGILYLGSGLGLSILICLRKPGGKLKGVTRGDLPWLAGAVLAGGVVAPVLLVYGLVQTQAASASLLLTLEGVFTSVIAWIVFKEHTDAKMIVGTLAITAGALVLAWPGGGLSLSIGWGVLAVVAACLSWSIDNNLTRKISAGDPLLMAAIKGLVAGAINTICALILLKASLPGLNVVTQTMLVGLLGYGLSLVLFILALRLLGTARTSAYFSLAPFVGAAAAIFLLHEAFNSQLAIAAAFMAAGLYIHMTEDHEHEHSHEEIEHDHEHVHDEHHLHEHSQWHPPGEPHCHAHRHEALTHKHPHYPDIHHRHFH